MRRVYRWVSGIMVVFAVSACGERTFDRGPADTTRAVPDTTQVAIEAEVVDPGEPKRCSVSRCRIWRRLFPLVSHWREALMIRVLRLPLSRLRYFPRRRRGRSGPIRMTCLRSPRRLWAMTL